MAGVQISSLQQLRMSLIEIDFRAGTMRSIIFIWKQILDVFYHGYHVSSCQYRTVLAFQNVKNGTQCVHNCVLNCCSWTQYILFLVKKKSRTSRALFHSLECSVQSLCMLKAPWQQEDCNTEVQGLLLFL